MGDRDLYEEFFDDDENKNGPNGEGFDAYGNHIEGDSDLLQAWEQKRKKLEEWLKKRSAPTPKTKESAVVNDIRCLHERRQEDGSFIQKDDILNLRIDLGNANSIQDVLELI